MSGSQFERYVPEVYAWAYRVLGRHQDALDVVQDVFLKWNEQCAAQPPHRPRGWLRRTTLNRAIDLMRGSKRSCSEEVIDGERSVAAGDDAIEAAELRCDVAAALDDLSDMQRSVVVAKVYDGLTFAQIAAEHELAVSTVKTHYVRALQAMHARLKDRWADVEVR